MSQTVMAARCPYDAVEISAEAEPISADKLGIIHATSESRKSSIQSLSPRVLHVYPHAIISGGPLGEPTGGLSNCRTAKQHIFSKILSGGFCPREFGGMRKLCIVGENFAMGAK